MIWRVLVVYLALLVGAVAAAGEDKPSWAVLNAADQLIAKRALFFAAGDGFVKRPDNLFVQFQLPQKVGYREDGGWRIEVQTKRFRVRDATGWQAWKNAQPKYSYWRVGTIKVKVLVSGVQAEWVDEGWFVAGTPPSAAEVMLKLDTNGHRHEATR